MKTKFLIAVLFITLIASLLMPVYGLSAVHAQATCLDAAGAPIPCPPTEEPSTGDSGGNDDNSSGGSQPGGGKPNPPSVITATPSATPTPLPTNMPLPVSDKPTENPTKNAPVDVSPTPQELLPFALPTDRMIATCSSADGKPCWEQAYIQCPNDIMVLETDPATSTFGFFCITDDEKPGLGLPLKASPDSTGRGWEGFCMGNDKIAQNCIDGAISICLTVGGNPSADTTVDTPQGTDKDGDVGGNTGTSVGCNDVPSPSDDALGQDTPGIPWGPIGLVGIVIILAVMLLPAIQKFKNKPDTSQAAADFFLTLDGVPGESTGKIPNNKNPELVKNKDEEPKAPFIHFGGVDGEAYPHDDTTNEIQNDGKKKKIRRPTTGGGSGLSGPGF